MHSDQPYRVTTKRTNAWKRATPGFLLFSLASQRSARRKRVVCVCAVKCCVCDFPSHPGLPSLAHHPVCALSLARARVLAVYRVDGARVSLSLARRVSCVDGGGARAGLRRARVPAGARPHARRHPLLRALRLGRAAAHLVLRVHRGTVVGRRATLTWTTLLFDQAESVSSSDSRDRLDYDDSLELR